MSTASTSGGKAERWDFLKGEGPSSQQYYYAEDKKAFKPGWKALRPAEAIQADCERKQQQERKEQRQEVCTQLRSDRLKQMGTYNNFNPITGQERKQDGSWGSPSDPWQHQKLGLKPVPHRTNNTPAAGAAAPAAPYGTSSDAPQRAAAIVEMRKERIANGGLVNSKRIGGTAKEALTWQ